MWISTAFLTPTSRKRFELGISFGTRWMAGYGSVVGHGNETIQVHHTDRDDGQEEYLDYHHTQLENQTGI